MYHKGNSLYAMKADGSGLKQLPAVADFSYMKYDQRSNMLYLVKKRQNGQGWTTGVGSVAYISVNSLLNGGQPTTVILNSDIHAETNAYVAATDSQHLLINGMFGSAVYNLHGRHAVPLTGGPLVVPGESASDIEGVTGTLVTTKNFKPAATSANNRIRNLDKAPAGLQAAILDDFKQQSASCIQKPDRYGSRLDMRFLQIDNGRAAVASSCIITGYWGKAGGLRFYESTNSSWQAIGSGANTQYGWPSCNFVTEHHISRQLAAKCDTGTYDDIDNPQ